MIPSGAILEIRDRYAREPRFPFYDWVKNAHDFYYLINFWDEVFKLSAGSLISQFKAYGDATQEPESALYFVINSEQTKKIRIWDVPATTEHPDVAFFFGRYPDLDRPNSDSSYTTTKEGEYIFEVGCDFDPDRLTAAVKMMHEFIHADTSTNEKLNDLSASFESRFRHLFPLPQIDLGPSLEDD